jgi:hypothetical protein
MQLRHQANYWQLQTQESYTPVYYKGTLAGFFKKEFANEITNLLNEDEVLKKALTIACSDLLKTSGGDKTQIKTMIQKYLKMSERPKYGTRAIAALLRQRQKELNLNTQDFSKFCDTFKLSAVELNNIYAGGAVEDSLLAPLSRILGISKAELLEIRDGSEEES